MEYKPERASVPTGHMIFRLRMAYDALWGGQTERAMKHLKTAEGAAVDPREIDQVHSIYDKISQPQEAMKHIADILTCDGRLYDQYSAFLKGVEDATINR